MKKLKIFTLLGLLTIGAAVGGFTACSKDDLATPGDVAVDYENVLTWSDVDKARTYTIEIKDLSSGEIKTSSVKREYFSLAYLAIGDYEIRIKAIGGDEGVESEWSETYYFERAYETGCLYRLVNNSEYEITSKGSASGVVIIEDLYRGKPVTAIADTAFRKCWGMEELIIGNNVRTIGESAFLHCKDLVSVTIPKSVTSIGVSAFQNCTALTEVTLPESVTEISDYMFAYCKSLTEVNMHNKLTTIGESAFLECSALTEVTIPDSVTTMKKYAFDSALALTKVTFGESLTAIDEHSFSNCPALTTVKFSSAGNLESIGQRAFSDAVSLETMVFPEGLIEIGYASFYGCTNLNEIDLPDSLMALRAYAFTGTQAYKTPWAAGDDYIYIDDWLVACSNKVKGLDEDGAYSAEDEIVGLKELLDSEASVQDPTSQATLREGTVGIADQTFYGAYDLMRVSLPASVRAIGDYSFFKCFNLRGVNTNKTQLIGGSAFAECKGLTQLEMGKGLKTIESYAFENCTGVVNNQNYSIIPETVEKIGTHAFKNTGIWANPDENGVVYAGNWVVGFNKANPGAISLKEGTVGISDYAFYQCSTLQSISGLSDVDFIGRAAFYECTNLGLVTLGRGLTKIEDYTFYKCSSLANVTLLGGIEEIGRSAFYKCEWLTSIDLSRCDVEKIGMYAFYACTNLESVDLGDSLTDLASKAFYKCTSLKEVTIPDSLTEVSEKAFYKCESLERVELGANVKTIANSAFYGCTSLQSLVIPDSVESIEKNAFYKAASLETITFGAGIQNIGDYAFYGAESLYTLSLPTNVTGGKYAFKGTSSLASLVLSKDVKFISDHAFYGAKQLTVYTDATDAESAGWSDRWNSSHRPVVWGCVLSDDGAYVLSVTIRENTLANVNAKFGFKAPEKDNGAQRAIGWATTEGGEVVYAIGDIVSVPVGTTLYPVYETYNPTLLFVHNVTFEDSDYQALSKVELEAGEVYEAPVLVAPKDSGYVFGGYYADASFTKEVVFVGNPIYKDKLIYVRWLTIEEWEAMQEDSSSEEGSSEEENSGNLFE